MIRDAKYMNRLLQQLIELLDIPPSYYQKAAERYDSLGKWLHREESAVAGFDPKVYPQGSFRYGTVIRPITKAEEYDLDLVCEIELGKTAVTQQQLKELVGHEIKAYAEANSFKEPAEEKKRCWRLNYADDVSFHMDILPAIPDDDAFKASLALHGVPKGLADFAVAITDKEHAKYEVIDTDWPRSNPKGFAGWFGGRMRAAAQVRLDELVLNRAYASVDDVPAYDWKTPLQRSIQILKRHRDVMFKDAPKGKPLSMIITTLSAHAYRGETDLYAALSNIVEEMPSLVRDKAPRVPNPVNPAEDFADKWASEPQLERNFWDWHTQVSADLENLGGQMTNEQIQKAMGGRFGVQLRADQLAGLAGVAVTAQPARPKTPPRVQITTAPKPWNRNG